MSEYHYHYCMTVNRGYGSLMISSGIYKTKTPIKYGESYTEFITNLRNEVDCQDIAVTSLTLIFTDHLPDKPFLPNDV